MNKYKPFDPTTAKPGDELIAPGGTLMYYIGISLRGLAIMEEKNGDLNWYKPEDLRTKIEPKKYWIPVGYTTDGRLYLSREHGYAFESEEECKKYIEESKSIGEEFAEEPACFEYPPRSE